MKYPKEGDTDGPHDEGLGHDVEDRLVEISLKVLIHEISTKVLKMLNNAKTYLH